MNKPCTYVLSCITRENSRRCHKCAFGLARDTARRIKNIKPKIVDSSKGKTLIPKPIDIDRLLRRIERGKLVTVGQIMEKLAKDFCTEYTCPLAPEISLPVSC